MKCIDRVETADPSLQAVLRKHPSVAEVCAGPALALTFWQGSWRREVRTGDPYVEQAGLIELMDNNPLVCADVFSVPDPMSTLVLLALGPLVEAGLLVEAPVVLTNASFDPEITDAFLRRIQWNEGVIIQGESLEDMGAVVANVLAKVRNPNDFEELDALYDERYGGCFFIRRDEQSEWDVRLTKDLPYAVYRLRITPGEGESLLTIQTMADPNGKCGAGQALHALNVMAGLEESLGV